VVPISYLIELENLQSVRLLEERKKDEKPGSGPRDFLFKNPIRAKNSFMGEKYLPDTKDFGATEGSSFIMCTIFLEANRYSTEGYFYATKG